MPPREEPCAPVEAYRWFVTFGTCWTEIIATTRETAHTIGMLYARTDNPHQVRARRMRPSDDERQARWKTTAEQLGLTDRKAGLR